MAAPATIADVRARPEFADSTTLPDAQVQAALDEALRATPSVVWDEQLTEAHLYLALHIIAMSPYGRDARLQTDEGSTLYLAHRERLEGARYAQVAPRTS